MVLKDFLFLNEKSEGAISNTLSNTEGESLVLQVEAIEGTPSVQLQGKTDTDSSQWDIITVITANGLKLKNDMVADGIYIAGIDGIKQLRVINNGTLKKVKVLGTITGNR